MTRRTLSGVALAVAIVSLVGARDAAAQGYGIYEHHACTMAMGGAGVADPCKDGSAVFFNPAALADIEGTVFTLGGVFIGPRGDFTPFGGGGATDLENKWITVPNLYYARSFGAAKFGLGVWAPYGLEIEWPEDFEGRFLSYKAKLQALYFQPSLAFKINDQVMVGGGVDIAIARVELRRRADLSTVAIPGTPFTFGALGVPPGTDFADTRLEATTTQFGVNLGVLFKANEQVSFGARFMSGQNSETDEGEFESRQISTGLRTPIPLPGIPAGTPLDALLAPQFGAGQRLESGQSFAAELPLPAQFVAGVMFKATDALKFKVDYQFTNWTAFDVLIIDLENGTTDTSYEDYNDTHGLRIGTEYMFDDRTAIRGGFITHTAGAPDQTVTPLLPEGARWELTVGFGRKLTDLMGIDFAYQYLHQPEREGRISNCGVERPTSACNSGDYGFRAHLIGANFNFGW